MGAPFLRNRRSVLSEFANGTAIVWRWTGSACVKLKNRWLHHSGVSRHLKWNGCAVPPGQALRSIGICSFIYGFICKRPSKNGVGFTGIIISLAALMIMGNQYTLYYDIGSYANLYEIGNASILFETFERAKLPVIDYFSAHAIIDILSRFIYWLFGGDSYTPSGTSFKRDPYEPRRPQQGCKKVIVDTISSVIYWIIK